MTPLKSHATTLPAAIGIVLIFSAGASYMGVPVWFFFIVFGVFLIAASFKLWKLAKAEGK